MSLTKKYLLAYNGAQLSIWGLTLAKIILHLAKGGRVSELYSVVRSLVRAGLAGSMLEILHAYLKVVKSPVATTAVQCIVRAFVIVGAVENVPGSSPGANVVSQSTWCSQMVAAWAVSETIRYGYYFSNLLAGKAPQVLTWLRYSAFIALYPIGIAGEMGCFYTALPALQSSGRWSVTMPNSANFSFSYPAAIWCALVGLYPVGGWSLYSYMLKQRKKQLSSA